MSIKKLVTIETIDRIFDLEPYNWGLRGDEFLWKEIQEEFIKLLELKNSMIFENELKKIYKKIITARKTETTKDMILMKGYPREGMSGGVISTTWWKEKGIPLLIKRYNEIR